MISTMLILLALVALDRASKIIFEALLEGGGTVTLIKGVLGLELLEGGNTGAAFGILKGGTTFLIIITVLLIVALVYALFFKRFSSRWMRAAALLITAGGAGNLYDRVAYGYVTDFIKFLFFDFPVFNLADCFVTAGAVIMAVWMIFSGKDTPIFASAEGEPKAEPQSGGDGE